MTIELGPEQQRVVDLAIRSGAYRSSHEVIATALSLLAEEIEDGAVAEARENEPQSTLAEVEAELPSVAS
jgi:Arc/MetJ-type ribon-helix-helix transcriptional regulator